MFRWLKITVSLLLLSCPVVLVTQSSAQDSLSLSGVVTGKDNMPLKGVSISIEGVYASPAVTDTNGRFELMAPDADIWLLIVPVEGYKSRRIYLNNRRELHVKLTPGDMQSGYDEVGNLFRPDIRRNFVSAYDAPDPGKSFLYPNPSIDLYFQGIVPGMLVTQQSGTPGSGATSYLRGLKSMYATNQPLYVVDGIPMETPGLFHSNLSGNNYNPLSSIDPLDITNITILKDYLSSSVYGMRGANGIILIETLRPTEARTTIDFSLRTGLSTQPGKIPQLNNQQYKSLANEVLMSSGLFEEDYKKEFFQLFVTEDDPEYYKYNKNTDWQKEIFRNALMNDAYIRVRGGDEIARYGLSVSYLNHQGVIKNTYASRFNVRFVGSFNVFQWLRMNLTSNLINNHLSLKESALSRQTSPVLTSLLKAPVLNPYQYDEDGKELNTLEEVNSLGISNPLSVINKFEGENQNYRFITSFKMEADLWKDYLKWTSRLGINFNSSRESIFMPSKGMELYYDGEVYNAAKSLKNYLYSIYTDNFMSYRQAFSSVHTLSAAVGFRLHQNKFDIDWGIAKNAHESDEYKQLDNGISYLREMGGQGSRWNRLGLYTHAGYSFKNKYFITANLVSEYSTRTGKNAADVPVIAGYPLGLFYSLGGAWRLSGESFLNDYFWLEDLKIRGSYGIAGNDDTGELSALDYYTVVHYRETSGMIPGIITDQNIKFETARQVNAGIDVSILASRLTFNFDLYRTRTEDLLVFEPQPSFTGFATIPANNGEILNNGWETAMYARFFDGDKFKWETAINLASFTNTVEKIKDNEVVTPFEGGAFISRVGEPIISFYGYQYQGVYASTAEAEADGLVTDVGTPFGAGDAKYADLGGQDGTPDGIINELDRTIIGSPVPDFFGGLTNTFAYRRWSLTANLQFVFGHEVFNYLRYRNENMVDLSNQSTNTLNRWVYEGQQTDVPRALYDDPMGNSAFSSRWIEDGSYFRLKHLTLAYTVPGTIWFLRNMQIFTTGTNLFTWNRYLGFDPEFSFSYFTMEQGIDYGMMPQTRRFIIGIRVGL